MTAFCYQFQKYKNWKKHLIEGDTTAKTNNPNFFLWASLMLIWAYFEVRHCMKSVFIRSFSGPYFTVFWTEYGDSYSIHIQSESRKMWSRKTPNTDTFHTVRIYCLMTPQLKIWRTIAQQVVAKETNILFYLLNSTHRKAGQTSTCHVY